eukprot:scaffold207_cov409-Prasinococcus_capsulatus_cf.AAC.59
MSSKSGISSLFGGYSRLLKGPLTGLGVGAQHRTRVGAEEVHCEGLARQHVVASGILVAVIDEKLV